MEFKLNVTKKPPTQNNQALMKRTKDIWIPHDVGWAELRNL